jgi:hypothetical protein
MRLGDDESVLVNELAASDRAANSEMSDRSSSFPSTLGRGAPRVSKRALPVGECRRLDREAARGGMARGVDRQCQNRRRDHLHRCSKKPAGAAPAMSGMPVDYGPGSTEGMTRTGSGRWITYKRTSPVARTPSTYCLSASN